MEGRKISFGFGWRIGIPDTRQRQNPRLFVFPTPITSSSPIDKKRHEHTVQVFNILGVLRESINRIVNSSSGNDTQTSSGAIPTLS